MTLFKFSSISVWHQLFNKYSNILHILNIIDVIQLLKTAFQCASARQIFKSSTSFIINHSLIHSYETVSNVSTYADFLPLINYHFTLLCNSFIMWLTGHRDTLLKPVLKISGSILPVCPLASAFQQTFKYAIFFKYFEYLSANSQG